MKTRTPIGNEDSEFVRCVRCGFPCNLSRDKVKAGNGNVYFDYTHTQDQAPNDFRSTFGCPKCGRGEYNRKLG